MKTTGVLNYNDICDMCNDYITFDGQECDAAFNDWMARYCMNATEYVDLMADEGFEADFELESLTQIMVGIVLFHIKNMNDGVDPEDSLEQVKEQVAGYFMFCLYNSFVEEGFGINIEVNEDNTGLRLVVDTDDAEGRLMVADIPEIIETAFEFVEFKLEEHGGEMKVDKAQFFKVLLGI